MGLRERKRLARHREILEAAARVFAERGFSEARIEEVAAAADVSPGTVYNYFPTKDALLLGVARHRRAEIPEAVDTLAASPPADPVRAFVRFFEIMAEHSMRSLNKPLWSHVHAAMLVGEWEPFGKERWRHEDELIARQRTLLRALQERGVLPAEPALDRLAVMINASAFFWWQRFLMEPGFGQVEFLRQVRRDLSALFGALGRADPRTRGDGAVQEAEAARRGQPRRASSAADETDGVDPQPDSIAG